MPLKFLRVLLAPALIASASAQTVRSAALLKLVLYEQTTATPAQVGFGSGAMVELSQPVSGTTATLRTPIGTKVIPRETDRTFSLIEPFFSRSAIDAQYPAGTYTIQLEGAVNTSIQLTLTDAQPNPPTILNLSEARAISTPANFRLTWAPLQSPTETDIVVLNIESDDGRFTYSSPPPGEVGALRGTSTSIDLNLPPNQSFTGSLMFLRTGQLSITGGTVAYSGWAAMTNFALRTLAASNVAAPVIAAQPISRSAAVGAPVQLSVAATGGGTLTYEWRHNGATIPGATSSTLSLPSVQSFQAGSYVVVVTNSSGSVTSNPVTLTTTPVSTAGSNARLANLSTRGLAGAGGESLIPGFYIDGPTPKRVLIRAIGPGLMQFGLPASEVVADPTITLVAAQGGTTVATNDDWGTSADPADPAAIATAATNAGAFALPNGSRDAALLVTLPPGGYTALVAGKSATPAVAIVEVYDLDAPGSAARLVNIATRGVVGSGSQILIPGFVVTGTAPKTYVIRGVGPGLAAFGQTGVLGDPVISVYQGSALLFSNDDWSNNTSAGELALASRRAGAFELPSGSRDAALLVTLQPGAYTFQLAGKGSATGTALVEVYEVP